MKEKLNRGFTFQLTFSGLLLLFFSTILAGLLLLSSLFYRNRQDFNKGMLLVMHTRTVIGCADSISILSQNLQWEALNYILSGNPAELKNYFSIRDSIQASAKYLIDFVGDNKNQQTNAITLQQQILSQVQHTDSLLQLRRINGDLKTPVSVKQQLMFPPLFNHIIEVIKTEALRLLGERRTYIYKTIDSSNKIFAASVILILILLIATFFFVFHHLIKRQTAEKKLIEGERKFQTLINSTKDLAIFMTDEKGDILDWYEGARKIKGYNREEVIGKNISIFYTPEAISEGEPEQNLKMAAEQGSFATEGWRLRKDGSKFWADVLITAIYNKEGKLEGFTKVTRDFTLHKTAEDRYKNAIETEKELNQLKSNFVSMASHEFRTPLSTILSSVSLIEHYRTTETQDKRDKHIQRINSAVREMVSLVEEFLSLEKIEEGKVQANRTVFNLKELVENVCSKFNNALKADQHLNFFYEGEAETALDKNFIDHILTNLISNAVKYSPAGSYVTVNAFVTIEEVKLQILDQGIGISQEDQHHLFERFYRASNVGDIKGTGLGLHISKRYIELMEGKIFVNSKPNEGCEFTIILPLTLQ